MKCKIAVFCSKYAVRLCAAAVAVLFVVGVGALAAGTYGSEADPLVTLSYLNDVLSKELTTQTEAQLTERLNALETNLNSKIDTYISTNGEQHKFVALSLTAGQTVVCEVGTEIIQRIGTTECVASKTPGLIDETDGTILDNGGRLVRNHLYAVTIAGRGFKAVENSTVVIRGKYNIQ